MSAQNTPQTTTQASGSFYKTLLALRNTYQPEDDLGIPKRFEDTSQAAQEFCQKSFADFSNKRNNDE